MGGFYGSVQVRTENRERVKQVAEQVVKGLGIRCLLGPALRGWVGVYPENGGQDQTVGEEIAKRLGGEVLHLLVHDSDVMAYWLWRDGKLVDSYWSKPGYFGEKNRAEEEAMAGQPAVLAEIVPGKSGKFQDLLNRGREDFRGSEDERLTQFGRLLGIDNVLAAYEYLKQEGTEGIKGWRKFEELPGDEIAKEKERQRQQRTQLTALKKHLKRSGLLLKELVFGRSGAKVAVVAEGFAVVQAMPYAEFKATEEEATPKTALHVYASPWNEPRSIDFDLTPTVKTLVSDSAGVRLAAVLGKKVVVLETETGRLLRAVQDDLAVGAALSPDGQLVAHFSRFETVVTNIATGQRVKTIPCACFGGLRFDPSGRWLVAILAQRTIAFVEMNQLQKGVWREKWVDGSPLAPPPAGVMQLHRETALEEVQRNHRNSIEASVEQIQKMADAAGKVFSAEDLQQMREQVEKIWANQIESQWLAISERGTKECPMSLEFSRDGRWLLCVTVRGLLVYDWESVISTKGDDMPELRWQYDVGRYDELGQPKSYVYRVVQEPDGEGVLFGGLTGEVYRMDLRTGFVRLLLTMPPGEGVRQMGISHDGQALSIVSTPRPGERPRTRSDDRTTWSIWSYPKLLAAPSDPMKVGQTP